MCLDVRCLGDFYDRTLILIWQGNLDVLLPVFDQSSLFYRVAGQAVAISYDFDARISLLLQAAFSSCILLSWLYHVGVVKDFQRQHERLSSYEHKNEIGC